MPRKGEIDPTKYLDNDPSGYYRSRIAHSQSYDKNAVDKIIVRVPRGTRELLNTYVEEMALKEPENPKYSDVSRKRPSLNALIKFLLQEETGIEL